MSSLVIRKSQPLRGVIHIPGDKSISHRAVIFGSVAEGMTRIGNLLEGEDVLRTVEIFREMGVKIYRKDGRWIVEGRGVRRLKPPLETLYCGNSGTTLRLMTGFLSGYPFDVSLTGDDSLNRRPMERVIVPLRSMGARIDEIHEGSRRVIRVRGGVLQGGDFKIPVASAQLKSALLLAGLASGRKVRVTEPMKSRDHTERMLKSFGADIRVRGRTASFYPGRRLKGLTLNVPGDFSSAAFFLVAALISPHPKSHVVVRRVGLNRSRVGALEVLKRMGGRIRVFNRKMVCGEPVGDIEARSSRLRGVVISGKIIPRLIDEIPILSVAAAFARGRTVIRDAEELRIKETDRIRAIASELRRFGTDVKEFRDGLEIRGREAIFGARGQSRGDHRMAMSLAVLGTAAQGMTMVDDTDCIATSFPGFTSHLRKLGGRVASRG